LPSTHYVEIIPTGDVPKTYNRPIGHALGGPTAAGYPYVVGEFGPELFVPNTSGTIIPNSQSNNFGGKEITMNNNIVVSGDTVESSRSRLVLQLSDVLNQAALAAGI